jgi:hypothetical protein
MHFEGVQAGPFEGRTATSQDYSNQPPDDEILNFRQSPAEKVLVIDYAWSKNPEIRAGELRITTGGKQIEKLVVTIDDSEKTAS